MDLHSTHTHPALRRLTVCWVTGSLSASQEVPKDPLSSTITYLAHPLEPFPRAFNCHPCPD